MTVAQNCLKKNKWELDVLLQVSKESVLPNLKKMKLKVIVKNFFFGL